MHISFLLAALESAKLGRGKCFPNPAVGAVAVKHGMIIAQSYHHRAGDAHAEILVMEQFPPATPDVDLYVTLEPCNHWGKTPPCVDAIINHGIARVIFAYRDPNPLVAKNKTENLLKSKGIDVIWQSVDEIDAFYQSYQYWTQTHLPWVTVKMAQSFDGKIAGMNGLRHNISNQACFQFTHQMRSAADIILTTAQTINQDDPLLTVRLQDKEIAKDLVIIDRSLRLNPHARALNQERVCHIYHSSDEPLLRHRNVQYHKILALQDFDINIDVSFKSSKQWHGLYALIKDLGRLGYHDLWVEAGSSLFYSLHFAQLVNRTFLYLAPVVIGESAYSLYRSANVFQFPHSIKWIAMESNMIAQIDWIFNEKEKCLLD